jgi:hypothetical protein
MGGRSKPVELATRSLEKQGDATAFETVVAEKFEALVSLGVANSRLKDFYDLPVICRTFELRRAALVEAIQRTVERRGTVLPSVVAVGGLTDEFAEHGPLNGAPS